MSRALLGSIALHAVAALALGTRLSRPRPPPPPPEPFEITVVAPVAPSAPAPAPAPVGPISAPAAVAATPRPAPRPSRSRRAEPAVAAAPAMSLGMRAPAAAPEAGPAEVRIPRPETLQVAPPANLVVPGSALDLSPPRRAVAREEQHNTQLGPVEVPCPTCLGREVGKMLDRWAADPYAYTRQMGDAMGDPNRPVILGMPSLLVAPSDPLANPGGGEGHDRYQVMIPLIAGTFGGGRKRGLHDLDATADERGRMARVELDRARRAVDAVVASMIDALLPGWVY